EISGREPRFRFLAAWGAAVLRPYGVSHNGSAECWNHDGCATLEGLGGFEDLVGAGADAEGAGEVDPADGAGGIDEELSGASDVAAVDACAFVKEIVAADHFGGGVGEERIGV